MVQRYKSEVRVYEKSFELVVMAYQKRWEFPKCELIPALISSEILEEDLNEDGSVHIVKRRCKIGVDAPFIIKKFAGLECMEFIQVNHLDKNLRTLKISAINESLANRVSINEYCSYYVMYPKNIFNFKLRQFANRNNQILFSANRI